MDNGQGALSECFAPVFSEIDVVSIPFSVWRSPSQVCTAAPAQRAWRKGAADRLPRAGFLHNFHGRIFGAATQG